MKVLYLAAEQTPYATAGGLGRVAYYLPKELRKVGVDVRVFIPKYGKIDESKWPMKEVVKGLRVSTQEGFADLICNVKMHDSGEVMTYFLENREYYELRANEYGYIDDAQRFLLLAKGALEFLRSYKDTWMPDVIHVNDWHTALVPQLLKTTYANDSVLNKLSTVLSIHNIRYQGTFDYRFASELDFDDGKSMIPGFYSDRLFKINPLKRGIIYADVINTVSPTHAVEILTEEHGEGLHKLLQEVRTKVFGILNGIDYDDFDPAKDPLVLENYTVDSLNNRTKNKVALQKEFLLYEDEEVPIFAFSNRFAAQKGLDLMTQILRPFLEEHEVQFVVNGGGDSRFVEFFLELHADYPDRIGVNLQPNFTLPRHIFSGADVILLPSKYEPCGMVQMEAMRYGCIPVVRNTGGLADTVADYIPSEDAGTGFVFQTYDAYALYSAMVRVIESYKYKEQWRKLQVRAMSQNFSWKSSAQDYEKLYKRGLGIKVQKESSKSIAGLTAL